jgi:uncharacterized protein (TIGR03437 family)
MGSPKICLPALILPALLVPTFCLAQSYTITTVAGGAPLISGIGDNGQATNAFLNGPGSVALDSAGNIYIADTGDQLIRKVDVNGIITTVAGTNGSPGFSGDGGPAKSAKLHGPSGVAVDNSGNIYIADTTNNRVRMVNTNGIITTVAGSTNTFSSGVGDGGLATAANLDLPKGVALDSAGNLYIADFGNFRVRKVGTNGIITTVAGNGYSAATTGNTGDGGVATNGSVAPFNIALDSAGDIFIADSQDNIIRKVTASNGNINTVAGYVGYEGYSGDGGSAVEATLMNPEGVAVDSAGNIFIADTGNYVIREVSPSGTINTIAGTGGTAGSTGDGGAATSATLVNPSSLALTTAGLIYISDQSTSGYQDGRIRLLTPPLPAPTINTGGVVPINSSSTTVEPGSWISIYGTNFSATTSTWSGNFPQSLGNVSVTIDSQPAYLWLVSPGQINLQVPNDSNTGQVAVSVTTSGGAVNSTVNLGPYGPSWSLLNSKYVTAIVFTPGSVGNSGLGYDIIGPAGALPYTTRPVKAGETVTLYGVGFGPTNPSVAAGQAYSGSAPSVTLPVIKIGGITAQVNYGGIVEAGLFQFNVVVPNAGSGDQLLVASIGGVTTPNNVYLTLQ